MRFATAPILFTAYRAMTAWGILGIHIVTLSFCLTPKNLSAAEHLITRPANSLKLIFLPEYSSAVLPGYFEEISKTALYIDLFRCFSLFFLFCPFDVLPLMVISLRFCRKNLFKHIKEFIFSVYHIDCAKQCVGCHIFREAER